MQQPHLGPAWVVVSVLPQKLLQLQEVEKHGLGCAICSSIATETVPNGLVNLS